MNSNANITFLRIPPYFGKFMAHPQECQLPLAIAFAAGTLKSAGFKVTVVDQWVNETSLNKVVRNLLSSDMDMLVIHVDTLNKSTVLDIAQMVRNEKDAGFPIIGFGQLAEVAPASILFPDGSFSASIFGEVELTLLELAKTISKDNSESLESIAGITFSDEFTGKLIRNEARDLLDDLDQLAKPDYSVFDLDGYQKQSSFVPIKGAVRWGWMLSSRGCPFNCEFCSPTLRKSCGKKYRTHSPEYLADVLEDLVNNFACNAVAFEDDVFSYSKKHTIKLCEEFIKRKIPILWTAQTHIATLDEEMISMMYKAGCRGLCMGVESGNEGIRGQIKNKSLKTKVLEKNVELLHDYGINTTLYFMIGSPGETLSQMQETMDLALKLKPMMIQLAFYTPYPGSRAWEKFMENNNVGEVELSHYNQFNINLSAADSEDVIKLYQRFYRKFYLNPSYISRFLQKRLPYTIRQKTSSEWWLMLRSLVFMIVPKHSIKLPTPLKKPKK